MENSFTAITELIDRVYDHAETQSTTSHARLILSGIGNNMTVRRVLSLLCATCDRNGVTDIRQARVLSGLPVKRFALILDALRACGALLPAILLRDDERTCPALVEALEAKNTVIENANDPQAETEHQWRLYAEMVNPALVELLKEEQG